MRHAIQAAPRRIVIAERGAPTRKYSQNPIFTLRRACWTTIRLATEPRIVRLPASVEDIVAVEGVGPKIAESVYAWFREADNLQMVDKLIIAGVNMTEDAAALSGPLAGLTIVVTGRLERHSRAQIEAQIKELGGVLGDSVSKKTSYLVAGADAGSKLAKAQKLGTPILDEAGFEALVAEKSV